MKELIEYLAKNLTSKPDEVTVTAAPLEDGAGDALTLKVDQADLSVVIGKQGRTAKAMRAILAAASTKDGRKYTLEIV